MGRATRIPWTKDQYGTPPEIWERVQAVLGEVELDPCADVQSAVRAKKNIFWSRGQDGLTTSWKRYRTIYMNCPYSHPAPWANRLCERVDMNPGARTMSLLPGTPATGWYRQLAQHPKTTAVICFAQRIRFWKEGKAASKPRGESTMFVHDSISETVEEARELQRQIVEQFGELASILAIQCPDRLVGEKKQHGIQTLALADQRQAS